MLFYAFLYLLCPVQPFVHIGPQVMFVSETSENRDDADFRKKSIAEK